MKKIFKLLLICSILIVSNASFAQTFGLRIGANFANQVIKDNTANYSDSANSKMLPGGNLGFVLDIPIASAFSIETGLMLNTKGYKIKESDATSKYREYTYLAYIDLPINAKYTFDLGGPKFYLTAGPYFAFGFFGKGVGIDSGNITNTSEWDIEWGNTIADDYKSLDIGLNFGGGFQFGSFVIGATYGLGLKNIAPYTSDGYKINNRVLGVSIGTNFGK